MKEDRAYLALCFGCNKGTANIMVNEIEETLFLMKKTKENQNRENTFWIDQKISEGEKAIEWMKDFYNRNWEN